MGAGGLVLAIALAVGGCASESDPVARRSGCAAPMPTVAPTQVPAGGRVTISVDYQAASRCSDVYDNGTPAAPESGRFTGVTVTLSQEGRTVNLATLDADASNRLSTTVVVPPDTRAGMATLSATSADNVILTVTTSRP